MTCPQTARHTRIKTRLNVRSEWLSQCKYIPGTSPDRDLCSRLFRQDRSHQFHRECSLLKVFMMPLRSALLLSLVLVSSPLLCCLVLSSFSDAAPPRGMKLVSSVLFDDYCSNSGTESDSFWSPILIQLSSNVAARVSPVFTFTVMINAKQQ